MASPTQKWHPVRNLDRSGRKTRQSSLMSVSIHPIQLTLGLVREQEVRLCCQQSTMNQPQHVYFHLQLKQLNKKENEGFHFQIPLQEFLIKINRTGECRLASLYECRLKALWFHKRHLNRTVLLDDAAKIVSPLNCLNCNNHSPENSWTNNLGKLNVSNREHRHFANQISVIFKQLPVITSRIKS